MSSLLSFGRRRQKNHIEQKIERLIRGQEWQNLLSLLSSKKLKERKENNSRVSNHRSSNLKQSSNNSESSSIVCDGPQLLNLAILFDAPLEIIKSMISCRPSLLNEVDHMGMGPVHIACAARGHASDIIETLLTTGNGSSLILVRDKFGRSPLHLLMYFVCYPQPRDKTKWQQDGACTTIKDGFGSGYIHSDVEVSPYMPGKRQKMSIGADDFQDLTRTVEIICKYGSHALFWRDQLGLTPVDILHEIKAVHVPSQRAPKWERADIVNVLIRSRLVKIYKKRKKRLEEKKIQSEESLPSIERTSCTTENSSLLSGLSKLEVDSANLSYIGMNLSVTQKDEDGNL